MVTSPPFALEPILPAVIRSRPTLRWSVAALCLALLMLRVGGVHLHLCFDGSEPPVSYHLGDSGVHHIDEHDAGESHSDRDLQIANDLAVKKPNQGQDATLALLTLTLLLFLLSPVRSPRPARRDDPAPVPSFSWLRPPLRGPPLPA